MVLKILIIYKNLLSHKIRWIEKIAFFNFTIYYKSEIKMGHIDFASKIKMFLPKNSTNDYISILRKQKLSDYL